MARTSPKKSYQEELRKIVSALKAYKPKKIILFGSAASGKITEDSDIDLFLIKNTHKPHRERCIEARSYFPQNIPVDLIIYTPEELKQSLRIGNFFIEDILNEGKVLYEAKR